MKETMPRATFERSVQIRAWIEAALGNGAESPSQVLEWIEQHKSKGVESPSLATIGRVMKEELGYTPIDKRWEKQKGKVKND
jgi:hypothetical protein